MQLQYEKDLEFFRKALEFADKGITEVNSVEDFKRQLGDKKRGNREEQLKYYSSFFDFNVRGTKITNIKLKLPEDIFSFIYKNMTDDDIIFNVVCFLRMYAMYSGRHTVVLSLNQLSRLSGINPNYIYFKPYSHFPVDEKVSANKLENDIRNHIDKYSRCKTIQKEIIQNRKDQVNQAMDNVDNLSKIKDSFDREITAKYTYSKTVEDLGKAYDDENQTVFEPIDLTLAVVRNFYNHTGRSVTTKFLRVLLVLQRSGIIDLQVVKLGVKKNPDGTITQKLLTNEEKSAYMDLKLKLAKKAIGLDEIKSKKDLESISELFYTPPYWLEMEIARELPNHLPYDKIVSTNLITFSKFGVDMLNEQYTSVLQAESTQSRIIRRTKNSMRALKEQTLSNFEDRKTERRKNKKKKSISPDEEKLYRILTNQTFTVNLQDFDNGITDEWIENIYYIPQYWLFLTKRSNMLITDYESTENAIPASTEGIINKKLKEKIDSLADNDVISEEEVEKLFEQAYEESIWDCLIF